MPPRPEPLPASTIDHLGGILAAGASTSTDPSGHLRELLQRTNLPERWKWEMLGGNQPNLGLAARHLLRWADRKGLDPSDDRYTAVGSVLARVLEDVGPDIGAEVVAEIVHHRLIAGSALDELCRRFQVPEPGLSMATWPDAARPWIDGDTDLQGPAPATPPLLDVGFLTDGIRQAGGVCRVELADGTALGTGFVVGAGLVLTNFHVIAARPSALLRLRFRAVGTAQGSVVPLAAADPVPSTSPVGDLDCALLRFDRSGLADQPAVLTPGAGTRPAGGDVLTLLQHPSGGPMKMAVTANAVIRAYPERHALRYCSATSGGSSGAPCFDEAWQVVAVHRAERATAFRTVREGVLIGSILDHIRAFI